jgi:hypothetical protein
VLINLGLNPSIFPKPFPIRLWYPSQHLLRQNQLPRSQLGLQRRFHEVRKRARIGSQARFKAALTPDALHSILLPPHYGIGPDPTAEFFSGRRRDEFDPMSVLRPSVRVNLNFGAQYNDGDPRGLFATSGLGVSWNFVDHWSVISEVFAIMGLGQSNPRLQSGIRYSPAKDIDWDLIYGRNLTGEGANWITSALTIRIGDN